MARGTVTTLTQAVEGLELSVDARELSDALAARDVLDAKLALAVAEFEEVRAHEAQGAITTRTWLRQEAKVAPSTADRVVTTGRRLTEITALAESVLAGRLSGGQLEVILAHIPARHRPRFIEHAPELVPHLEPLSIDATARVMQEWRRRADAERDTPFRDDVESTLHLGQTLDGVGVARATLDTDDTALLDTALRTADSGDTTVPVSRRRAEALMQICQHFLDHQHRTPDGRRQRQHVNVVVTTDQHGNPAARYVEFDAPVSSIGWSVLSCDANWHRLLLDPASARLDYGRATRDWAPDLYNAIVLRDGGCRAGACDAPASWCDVHHVHYWEHGGPTDLDNGVLLCRRHHRMVHKPGYHFKLLPDGTTELTTPTGEHRVNHPRGPDLRPPGLFSDRH